MPLPDRNPKRRCQTALISTTQPITTATPIDDASGTAIARKPQISIRMPQIISGLPVSAADIELVIRTSSLNHRRQSSSSPASRFHLLPAFCCNASLDVGWRTRTLLRRVIVAWLMVQIAATVLPAFHAPEFVLPVLIVLLGVGFPVGLVLAWAFDVTPSGIEKTPEGTGTSAARNMRYAWALAGLGLLIAAVGVGAYWFWHRPVTKRTATAEISNVVAEKTAAGPGVAISEKSIAVLPF